MARHTNRARVRACDGSRLKSISEPAALSLVDQGRAQVISKAGEQLEIEMNAIPDSSARAASLTVTDMVSNAIAKADRRNNSSAVVKVKMWPFVHDTFAVRVQPKRLK
jgi:hypothetical protein